jgi:hypothetical protein
VVVGVVVVVLVDDCCVVVEVLLVAVRVFRMEVEWIGVGLSVARPWPLKRAEVGPYRPGVKAHL